MLVRGVEGSGEGGGGESGRDGGTLMGSREEVAIAERRTDCLSGLYRIPMLCTFVMNWRFGVLLRKVMMYIHQVLHAGLSIGSMAAL